MYDTQKSRLPIDHLTNKEKSRIVNRIKVVNEGKTDFGRYTKGYLGNMDVKVTEQWLYTEGSLPKFLLGDNIQTLTRRSSKEAIEMLSDGLGMAMDEAQILRIDIAQNFKTKKPEHLYYDSLGSLAHFTRLEQPNGVYFRTAKKELLFYSKVIEQKVKGYQIDPLWKHSTMLRYEFRLMKRIAEQLSIANPCLSLLHTEEVYLKLLTLWYEHYTKIKKVNDLIEMKPTSSTKELERSIAAMSILALGEDKYLQMVKEWQRLGMIEKGQAQRHRDLIRTLSKMDSVSSESDHIKELDEKVNLVYKYCR
jgi:hypothetical protein